MIRDFRDQVTTDGIQSISICFLVTYTNSLRSLDRFTAVKLVKAIRQSLVIFACVLSDKRDN